MLSKRIEKTLSLVVVIAAALSVLGFHFTENLAYTEAAPSPGWSREARLLRVNEGTPLATAIGPEPGVIQIAYVNDGEVQIAAVQDTAVVSQITVGQVEGEVRALSFMNTASGRYVVWVNETEVFMAKAEDGASVRRLTLPAEDSNAVFVYDGAILLCGRSARLWLNPESTDIPQDKVDNAPVRYGAVSLAKATPRLALIENIGGKGNYHAVYVEQDETGAWVKTDLEHFFTDAPRNYVQSFNAVFDEEGGVTYYWLVKETRPYNLEYAKTFHRFGNGDRTLTSKLVVRSTDRGRTGRAADSDAVSRLSLAQSSAGGGIMGAAAVARIDERLRAGKDVFIFPLADGKPGEAVQATRTQYAPQQVRLLTDAGGQYLVWGETTVPSKIDIYAASTLESWKAPLNRRTLADVASALSATMMSVFSLVIPLLISFAWLAPALLFLELGYLLHINWVEHRPRQALTITLLIFVVLQLALVHTLYCPKRSVMFMPLWLYPWYANWIVALLADAAGLLFMFKRRKEVHIPFVDFARFAVVSLVLVALVYEPYMSSFWVH